MRRILSLSIAAIAALVGTAGPAQSADGEAPARGERTREQAALFADRMFERIDADGDGAISRDESRSAALARFDSADANSDGTLSVEERRSRRALRRSDTAG